MKIDGQNVDDIIFNVIRVCHNYLGDSLVFIPNVIIYNVKDCECPMFIHTRDGEALSTPYIRLHIKCLHPYYVPQIIYQLSHEILHYVLYLHSDKNLQYEPATWFEEAICEAFSLFILGKFGYDDYLKCNVPNLHKNVCIFSFNDIKMINECRSSNRDAHGLATMLLFNIMSDVDRQENVLFFHYMLNVRYFSNSVTGYIDFDKWFSTWGIYANFSEHQRLIKTIFIHMDTQKYRQNLVLIKGEQL